ncbi:DoxX family protein [Vibrio mediterranei]|uniref:DoxX family protein n=1 Tax=Vibrio mediterranei TaxID=689 RepID=UPI001EFE9341|nr:DoxX family protein [Vibrio mediterranei]MCG9661081.1 DoxX family protein [Vibrio mediterranei]
MKSYNRYWPVTTLMGLCVTFLTISHMDKYDGIWSTICMIGFAVLIPVFAFGYKDNSVPGLLFTIFSTTIVVSNADQHNWSIVGWSAAIIYIPLLLQLVDLVRKSHKKTGSRATALTLIRMFIGLNWLTHCTGKLFTSQLDPSLVRFFSHVVGSNLIGIDFPISFTHYVIILDGLLEFVSAISLGLGLLTRFGAFVASGYLVIAQLLSGHFEAGYTWALPESGWELGFFFFMVTYPFMFSKTAGPISLDSHYLTERSNHGIVRILSGA